MLGKHTLNIFGFCFTHTHEHLITSMWSSWWHTCNGDSITVSLGYDFTLMVHKRLISGD